GNVAEALVERHAGSLDRVGPDPLRQEGLDDRIRAPPGPGDEFRFDELADRALDARGCREAVARAIFLAEQSRRGLSRERLQDEALRARDRVPDIREVRVLGPEDAVDRPLERAGGHRGAVGSLFPEGIAELLCPVRVAAGDREQLGADPVVDALPGRLEALMNELG